MKCAYHKESEATGNCNICKKPLCKECLKIQEQYYACPQCAKNHIERVYQNFKSGLTFNILSVAFFVGFLVLYIIDIFRNMKTLYILLGAVVAVVLGTLSICLLIFTIKKMKNTKKTLLEIANLKEIEDKEKKQTL